MSFRDRVEEDPLSTTLDRLVASQYPSVAAWEAAQSRLAWSRYSASERAEMTLYWAAINENVLWNAAVERSWARKTLWSLENAAWRSETDEEFAARTAKLKWRPAPSGFEFIAQPAAKRMAA